MSTFPIPPSAPPAGHTPPAGYRPQGAAPPGARPTGTGTTAPARSRTVQLFLARLVWEGALLLLAIVLTVVLAVQTELFDFWRGFWFNLAGLALAASGFALSLRTATPNLAIGALAGLAGTVYGKLVVAGWSGLPAGLIAILSALAIGLILGLLTGLTSAPAWAVSLAGAVGGQALLFAVAGSGQIIVITNLPVQERGSGVGWALLAVFGSLAGGALWLIPGVRRSLSTNRTSADPAWRGPYRVVGALVGLTGSSLLAGLSGILMAKYTATAGRADDTLLPMALGAALLGGVSVFGRRGGVAGTLLASWLLVLGRFGLAEAEAPLWIRLYLMPAVAILLGLLVGWFLERLGGPEPAPTPPAPAGPVPPQAGVVPPPAMPPAAPPQTGAAPPAQVPPAQMPPAQMPPAAG